MIPEKLTEILSREGVAAIATQGDDGPHLVNTWHSHIQVVDGDRLLIPAGWMHATERNINRDNRILLCVGCKEIMGKHGPGAGFLITGRAAFETQGAHYDALSQYPWARAALVVTIASVEQTL